MRVSLGFGGKGGVGCWEKKKSVLWRVIYTQKSDVKQARADNKWYAASVIPTDENAVKYDGSYLLLSTGPWLCFARCGICIQTRTYDRILPHTVTF